MNKKASFTIGKVTGFHGLNGNLKVWSYAESIDSFSPGSIVLLKYGKNDGKAYTINNAQPHKKGILLNLKGVDSRNLAEELLGCDILIDREQLPEPEEDSWYWEDLLGLEVHDQDRGFIGNITQIFPTGANDILVVTHNDQETLVPMHKHFVESVDIQKDGYHPTAGRILMDFTVLTLFPELINSFFEHGMIQRGIEKKLISGRCINIRDFSTDRHHTVDDRPYGGGSGMIMKPEPLKAAVEAAKVKSPQSKVVMMTPQGTQFTQDKAFELASLNVGLIFICGRYEGIDERITDSLVDEEISIGDYVMTGGELASMVIIDSVARLIPGVLGCSESPKSDSFIDDRLEYAQYTRPEDFEELKVPEVLLSGNHGKIREWRKRSSFQRTFLKRPDLLVKGKLSDEEKQIVQLWRQELKDLAQ